MIGKAFFLQNKLQNKFDIHSWDKQFLAKYPVIKLAK